MFFSFAFLLAASGSQSQNVSLTKGLFTPKIYSTVIISTYTPFYSKAIIRLIDELRYQYPQNNYYLTAAHFHLHMLRGTRLLGMQPFLKLYRKRCLKENTIHYVLEELACQKEVCPQASNIAIPPHCFHRDYYINV